MVHEANFSRNKLLQSEVLKVDGGGILVLTQEEHFSKFVQYGQQLRAAQVLVVHDFLQVMVATKISC